MFSILGADQKQYGPVTADQVRQWIDDGRADGQTLAQAEGTAEWKPLARFPEFASLFPSESTPPPPGLAPPATPSPPNYMLPAVLATLCCCLPFGVLAIIFAAQTRRRWAAGDWAGAVASSKKARIWCWIAFVVGVVWLTILSRVVGQLQGLM